MTNEVLSLNAARATKSGDCQDWTVRDALQNAIDRIDAGEDSPDMVYVCMREKVSVDGQELAEYDFQCAGGSKLELAGLLSRYLDMLWHEE